MELTLKSLHPGWFFLVYDTSSISFVSLCCVDCECIWGRIKRKELAYRDAYCWNEQWKPTTNAFIFTEQTHKLMYLHFQLSNHVERGGNKWIYILNHIASSGELFFYYSFVFFFSISAILHLVFQNLSRFHPDHQSSLLENSQKSLLMLTDRERLDLPGS